MDQDNTKGQDKRNWRERLGIGAQAGKEQAARDLPKISDDYRPAPAVRPAVNVKVAPRVVVAAKPAAAVAKPAPMAPRATPRPAVTPPVSPDKLAERLRSQREASTKLAEQRVQVARQRAEVPPPPPAAVAPPPVVAAPPRPAVTAGKPKFTFAEEAPHQAPAPVRAPVPPPQLQPARPPLGAPAQPTFQQRPPVAPYQPQQQQPPTYPPNVPMGGGYQPNYTQQPVPPYRPIDPATGYAPQQGYVPQQRGFNVPLAQGGFAPVPGPRLNVPQRPNPALNPNLQAPPEFTAQPNLPPAGYQGGQRLNRPALRAPAPPTVSDDGYDEEFYDEAPQQRGVRPSSTDYQNAYRDAEYGYEEELPRSKTPWILAGLILLAMLAAGLGVWAYQSSFKSILSGQDGSRNLPAVTAPEAPAKVQAEQPVPAAEQPAAAASPTKKKIYDRIVGDQEVLGGEVSAPVEEPAAIPAPSNNAEPPAQPLGGSGEDAAPLPIPPPPGGGGDQQGALDPAPEKQSAETFTPAAGESQAAVAADAGEIPLPAAAPPSPGQPSPVATLDRSLAAEPVVKPEEPPASEVIADVPAPDVPAPKKIAAVEKRAPKVKEKQAKEKTEKVLGSKPVVLVPISGKSKVAAAKTPDAKIVSGGSAAVATDGGLYGTSDITEAAPITPVETVAPVKKKRTLADLFAGSKTEEPADQSVDVAAVEPPTAKPAPVLKKTVAPAPQPAEVATNGGGGFVVQLASFRSRNEATAEYARLKAKHAGALAKFQPIISEATVAGSTRFRLSVGEMASKAQANAVCASLFAGGERDCLVKSR
jgi:hypothetical protein